ncbi:hypothetical protein [Sphingomonas sp. SUN039]|uniref:hypothetical protein n=1 Tax=Sphingomonas sp. SUN039 TaxID=2937787 RepID=UPI0021646940|nr:hypothetical protein [Sphingomonas sp. SUN039]UVO52970.1 hypothetical protein M0209_02105 [Sphingomonas sp. SUN039]
MTAGEAVRAAVVAGMLARAEFTGIDGLRRETAANALPQARVEAGVSGDWSTKDAVGREVRAVATIRVARGQAMRLPMMVAAAENVGTALSGDLGGWQVGSAVLVRSRSFDAPDGTKAATVEHRVRVLAA